MQRLLLFQIISIGVGIVLASLLQLRPPKDAPAELAVVSKHVEAGEM